jgi:hypothetical protein
VTLVLSEERRQLSCRRSIADILDDESMVEAQFNPEDAGISQSVALSGMQLGSTRSH